MRRTLQLSGLSAILVTGFLSTHAFAQEPTEGEQPAQEQKAEQPVSEAPASATAAVVPPAAKPKFGDLSTNGYFRGGFGGNLNQRGRMTCFGLSTISGSLKSKYRLGNECEQWAELLISTVMYVGDDGTVGSFYFRPVAFIPTTTLGYSPAMTTSTQDRSQPGQFTTGATVAFPDLYADMKGISWLYGGTAWAGSRYYKRESVYISEFFYWNPSGVGAGIEDVSLGKIWDSAPDLMRDVLISYGAFAVDGQPNGNPYLPERYAFGVRNDLQIRGLRPYQGGELQIGFQYITNWSGDKNSVGDPATSYGGWGITLQHVQDVLGGNNKLAVQYGRGGGTGFGTLARFYYPDFSLRQDLTESRLRIVDVLTIQPTAWLGTQLVGVYQRDDDGTGTTGAVDEWYSAGTRVSVAVAEHAKVLGEVGYDTEFKSGGAPKLWLLKATGAIAITASKGFWARPELRLFLTWAQWSQAAGTAGIDSGQLYTDPTQYPNLLSGMIAGLQAETMW